jgi:hypothetical protein
MSTSTSYVFGKLFSLDGLKLILAFIIIGTIYRFIFSYIELKLGILDLEGSFDFKIKKTAVFGAALAILGSILHKIFSFNSIFLGIHSSLGLTYN